MDSLADPFALLLLFMVKGYLLIKPTEKLNAKDRKKETINKYYVPAGKALRIIARNNSQLWFWQKR
jgi:hypothetical protein